MTYGDFQIHALPEGRFTVGLDKTFVPFAEGDALPSSALFVSVTPFVVVTPRDTILLDCGLGEYAQGRGVDFLLSGLARHGISREGVTRVVLSHLHFDHAGGAVYTAPGPLQDTRPTFPEASYHVQRGELTAPGYKGTSLQARDRVVEALDAAGQLAPLDGDGFITDEIEVEVTGGHTPFHQIVRLRTGALQVLFGGDVVPAPNQLGRRFQAKYDWDGAASQAWRDRLAAEVAEDGSLLLFYHSTAALAGFVDAGPKGGYRVEPASDLPLASDP